jgi:transcription elongation regulator 1
VEKRPGDAGKEAAIEAEMRAARERALIPLENRVKSFKEMLKEKDVSLKQPFILQSKLAKNNLSHLN